VAAVKVKNRRTGHPPRDQWTYAELGKQYPGLVLKAFVHLSIVVVYVMSVH